MKKILPLVFSILLLCIELPMSNGQAFAHESSVTLPDNGILDTTMVISLAGEQILLVRVNDGYRMHTAYQILTNAGAAFITEDELRANQQLFVSFLKQAGPHTSVKIIHEDFLTDSTAVLFLHPDTQEIVVQNSNYNWDFQSNDGGPAVAYRTMFFAVKPKVTK